MTKPAYDWQDDARRSYTLACKLIGLKWIDAKRRIVAALRRRAGL